MTNAECLMLRTDVRQHEVTNESVPSALIIIRSILCR